MRGEQGNRVANMFHRRRPGGGLPGEEPRPFFGATLPSQPENKGKKPPVRERPVAPLSGWSASTASFVSRQATLVWRPRELAGLRELR